MIDLQILRTQLGKEQIRVSELKRGNKEELLNKVSELVEIRVKKRFEMEQINKEMNIKTKEASFLFKRRNSLTEEETKTSLLLKQEIEEIKRRKEECALLLKKLEEETHERASAIGNLVDASVHVSADEQESPVICSRQYIKKPYAPEVLLPFDRVLERLDAVDTERGSKISGHRGYFLKNYGVILSQALVRYGMDFLKRKNFDLIQTPYFMRKSIMKKTAQLSDFDEQLYKVEGSSEESYLIATSEQPLSALHADEWLRDEELPIQYCGYSTCFRKEAGAHGKDNRGIFRVHQFEKIEQFILTSPDTSASAFFEMVERSKEFYNSLDIGYQVISIVSGALNNAASIKYDLEAYFPCSAKYRELVSCSNCTDYQSRDLNIRYGYVDSNESTKKFVHLLNGTLCAVQRTLCCLLENYQGADGVFVPEALIPYVGKDFIPYTK
ncbi:seryl-tRNA synthetase [Nematocida sp. LUAm3]|nr:seryl-tRNA synthetase [Nematocida sp. LUAm3]KAI5174571.1 seryl-tRNA synthetase [Nematocida sp. LUAm2]KAI5178023.1 seryl-tRNA synthetase [Nematocida sp. LUAm1]